MCIRDSYLPVGDTSFPVATTGCLGVESSVFSSLLGTGGGAFEAPPGLVGVTIVAVVVVVVAVLVGEVEVVAAEGVGSFS